MLYQSLLTKANRTASVLFLATCSFAFSPPAYAMDDDVKAVLGGILGAIIVEGAKEINNQDEQQSEEIQWNDAPSVRKKSSYDPRVAEIQANLKTLGLYHSSVDGIYGRNTYNAIDYWENHFQEDINQVNGKISDDELLLIKEMAASKDAAPIVQNVASSNASYKPLQDTYTDIAQFKNTHKACIEFLESGHAYASGINLNFRQKSSEFLSFLGSAANKQAQCLGVTEQQKQNAQQAGKAAYERTQEYEMYKLLVPMALSDDGVANDVVRGCNAYIASSLVVTEKLSSHDMNPNTCEL